MQEITYTNSKGASRAFYYKDAMNILDDFKYAHSVNNWTTTGYNQHGATYIKTRMREATIELSFWVIGSDMPDFYTKREEIFHLFNPMNCPASLEYYNGIVDRMLNVYVDTMPEEIENYGNGRLYRVILKAASPFFYDKELNGIQFSDGYGGIAFSMVFNPEETFGWDRHSALAVNNGDIEAPVRIIIRNAEMVNPRIILEDGRFIGLNKTIHANEEVIIDTSYGNKSITINGKNADAFLIDGSSWIQLPVGATRISCATEEGSPNVYMTWYNYYLGV